MFNKLMNIINYFIICLFSVIYKYCNIDTAEDRFHKHKKDNKQMNKIKIQFEKECEFEIVKNNTLDIVSNKEILKKYDITSESILNNGNNKLTIYFKDKCIYIYFNHYYLSGSNLFILLNQMVNSKCPTFLKTNPYIGLTRLPYYIRDLSLLKKKEYLKNETQVQNLIIEKNINVPNKRYYLYFSILNKIYNSLKLNRPMVVALSLAFDEIDYINNNIGIIIINYDLKDTIETLEAKINKAKYQAYCSNFILNCPLPNISIFGNLELRDYVDCIVSALYIKSDYDFKIAWNCSKMPVEQMYVGSVSILHSDNTMDINMCFNTCSKNYNELHNSITNYFE
jgi:hypothetical protein